MRLKTAGLLDDTWRTPGPGQYRPTSEFTKESRHKGGRIGTGKRSELYSGEDTPGVGQYDVRGPLGGPKWGFGTGNRANMANSDVPGPGTYNLKPTFADVPKYLMTGPQKIHL